MAEKKAISAPKDLPQKQGWRLFFEIAGLLIWATVAVIASQLVIGLLMAWMLGADAFNKPVVTAIYSAISYVAAMFLVIYVPPKLLAKISKRATREELGLTGWPTWTDIGLAPIGFVVYLLIAAGLTAFFNQFAWFDASETQDVGFSVYIFGFDRLMAFLTLVVVAPMAEEVIFRGWLYGKIRVKLCRELPHWAAVIISALLVSVLFGLVHMQWNVGVNVFAMSLVLCALREVTGTIYAGILLHTLKNGVAFFLLYVLGMS